MDSETLQIGLFLLATVALGAIIGWLIRGPQSKRILNKLSDELQLKIDELTRQRDHFSTEIFSLRRSIESQQDLMNKHEIAATRNQTELESARERMKSISKELFDGRAERDDLGVSIINSQNALTSAKQQASELKNEFVKTGVFYKGELTKAFEKRKVLEMKVDNAVLEHDSLSNLLDSSRSEQTSVNKMLDTAHIRLDNLDVLEQNVIKLEAENAQIKHDAARAKQETEALQRDMAEMEALKTQNKELSHCLKSMENSRKQYEVDAKRYRDHAGKSEQQSETLRVRSDDMQKSFANIETKQRRALKEARTSSTAKKSNGHAPPPKEVDDLKHIVGIGKVFEKTLHDLGITSYRQIAAFTVTDIARINRELKEFKGRMEQDDWVGQAKELCFKKYG